MYDDYAVEVPKLLNHLTQDQVKKVWNGTSAIPDSDLSQTYGTHGFQVKGELKETILSSFTKGWMLDEIDSWMIKKVDDAKFRFDFDPDTTLIEEFGGIMSIHDAFLFDNKREGRHTRVYSLEATCQPHPDEGIIGYAIYFPITSNSFTITFQEDPEKSVITVGPNPVLINSMKPHVTKKDIDDAHLIIGITTNESWDEIKERVYLDTLIAN